MCGLTCKPNTPPGCRCHLSLSDQKLAFYFMVNFLTPWQRRRQPVIEGFNHNRSNHGDWFDCQTCLLPTPFSKTIDQTASQIGSHSWSCYVLIFFQASFPSCLAGYPSEASQRTISIERIVPGVRLLWGHWVLHPSTIGISFANGYRQPYDVVSHSRRAYLSRGPGN